MGDDIKRPDETVNDLDVPEDASDEVQGGDGKSQKDGQRNDKLSSGLGIFKDE